MEFISQPKYTIFLLSNEVNTVNWLHPVTWGPTDNKFDINNLFKKQRKQMDDRTELYLNTLMTEAVYL